MMGRTAIEGESFSRLEGNFQTFKGSDPTSCGQLILVHCLRTTAQTSLSPTDRMLFNSALLRENPARPNSPCR